MSNEITLSTLKLEDIRIIIREEMELFSQRFGRLPDDIPNKQKAYLSIEEAADFLGVAKPTIYSWHCRGKIKAFKSGRKLLFERKYLEEWLQSRQTKTNSELEKEALEALGSRNSSTKG